MNLKNKELHIICFWLSNDVYVKNTLCTTLTFFSISAEFNGISYMQLKSSKVTISCIVLYQVTSNNNILDLHELSRRNAVTL